MSRRKSTRFQARALATLGCIVALVASAPLARAESPESSPTLPSLGSPPALGALAGRRVTRVEVITVGERWSAPVTLTRARAGDVLGLELVHRAMRELTDSGRYASVSASAEAEADGVALRFEVLPRRIIASVRLSGAELDADDTLRAAAVREGGEVTAPELRRIAERVRRYLVRHGFPSATVGADTIDTDDPMGVVLVLDVRAGPPLEIVKRTFAVSPYPPRPELTHALDGYHPSIGDRADQDQLDAADRELERALETNGFHRATVEHRVEPAASGARLVVTVRAGPLIRVRFEGNRHFDASQLEPALELAQRDDRAPAALTGRLRDFYAKRGFLDVEIMARELGAPEAPIHDLVFTIREHAPVRVTRREYPCLTGERAPSEVGSEIDSFLSEELPGADILSPVDPRVVDETLGPTGTTGSRVAPFELSPWKTYVADVYDRAMKHLQDLYRSEGYLSATVGPAQLLRRRCALRSQPGRCEPVGPQIRPPTTCRYDELGLPLDEPPPDATRACVPDPVKGVRCEPNVVLHIPIKLGPRTLLYDVAFEGNQALFEQELEEVADIELGAPASQVELDNARRRVLDAYAERGFAFAEVDASLDFSPDRTRARARFTVSERERVMVSRIIVRGARRTSESLIRSRVALEVGAPYRRSDVRKTEERLATLGVFSSVTVGFEDPYVPAREKEVVITVQERLPQYLDIRPGFSTGEGVRISFEYGHRNLGGNAIALTLRSQLGYLPNAFILEGDVRQKYEALDTGERLERRNTLQLEFPNVGLGPLFRLSLEGVDVRDNARDYGLTKDAGIVTMIYRPTRQFSAQIGGTLERNDATIFGDTEKSALTQFVRDNPSLRNVFRVPQGTTFAIAEGAGFIWDRRDNPFGATRGTLLAAGVEHVHADPVGETRVIATDPNNPFGAATSEFLRFTGRAGGYVRLSEKGLALAVSFRTGYNRQLLKSCRDPDATLGLGQCSLTYPDRLFFLGGVDSLRGFLQDSLIPEDVAEELLHPTDPAAPLTVNEIVIRGGDVFINPRLELRVPLTSAVSTALFLDTGNLWQDPSKIDPFRLRYALGSGLRIGTPIGPLAFDYGFNLERVLDDVFPARKNQRYWEDLGAFHFSIGLF